jgi:hypothetical protein
MRWRVTITFPEMANDEGNDLLHRVRNFGETLSRHFTRSDRGSIELKQIDRATRALVVERIRARALRRTVYLLKQMAAAEFPERTPEITTEKMSN